MLFFHMRRQRFYFGLAVHLLSERKEKNLSMVSNICAELSFKTHIEYATNEAHAIHYLKSHLLQLYYNYFSSILF